MVMDLIFLILYIFQNLTAQFVLSIFVIIRSGKCDHFFGRTGTEGGEFPESLYRGGCRDDHYFLRDSDAGAVTVLLDGEDHQIL